jgi:hypothetical protein
VLPDEVGLSVPAFGRTEDAEDGEDGEDGWRAGCDAPDEAPDDAAGDAGDVGGADELVTAGAARDPAGDGGPDGCEADANPVTLISTKQASAARARAATTTARR